MTWIVWNGFGERELYGLVFKAGVSIEVTDEEVALDILTQPNEPFEDVTDEMTASDDLPQPDQAPVAVVEDSYVSNPKRGRRSKKGDDK